MAKKVTLAIDACGGDNAPDAVLKGVELACGIDADIDVVLCGTADVVGPFCANHPNCKPLVAEEVIGMGEHPAQAVKSKKRSSIVLGCKAVREGIAEGFFSAGSTGACLVAATLHIGRLKGVKRPALGIVLPTYEKPTLLLDVGANADVKVDYLVQFAQMGSAYMQASQDVDKPQVGLLNIGEEASKGSSFAIEAHDLMEKSLDNFKGNAEPYALMNGDFDVVVTDGFTGNVTLKTIEATSGLLFKYVKEAMTATAVSKIGAILVKGNLKEMRERINPDAYGGSPLLGVNGVCMVGHGSSGPEAIMNGILACAGEVRADLCAKIEQAVNALSEHEEGETSN